MHSTPMSQDGRNRPKSPSPAGSRSTTPPLHSFTQRIRFQYSNKDHDISTSEDDDPTEWTTITRINKEPLFKRPRTTSDQTTTDRHMDTQDAPTDFTTRNPFIPLNNSSDTTEPATPPPPPPIYIKQVTNFATLRTSLISMIGEENFTTKSSLNGLQLKTKTINSYRTAIKYLQQIKADFHTYKNPSSKTHRIVIRHLHHTTPTDLISTELATKGFTVKNVHNALHRLTKLPLPLFFVDLEETPNLQTIYKLTNLLNTHIAVEEPRRQTDLPQCHRCQEYNHTKSYCYHEPRCVRCGKNHPSNTCSKTRDVPATCALCSANHPANYKGCTVYKELQKRRRQTDFPRHSTFNRPQQTLVSHPLSAPQPSSRPSTPVNTSQVTAETIPSIPHNTAHITPSPPSTVHIPNHTLPKTYAQATLSHRPTQPTTEPQYDNLTQQLNSFLDDLKSLLTPILNLLTTVITELLKRNDK